jgi:mannose-6-phosphate isomerase-like protein (cupin superfamily)
MTLRIVAVTTIGVAVAVVPPAAAYTVDTLPLHLGDPFAAAAATPVAEVLADPDRFVNRVVRVSGIVASACDEEGCFIEVVPPQGGGDSVVVNFPGLKHTFPTDSAGLAADVEGLLYRKVYHRARVSHWQHHSYRPGVAVPEFSSVLRLEARAARLAGPRSPVPPPPPLQSASAAKVDLATSAFEDEGFGVDRRVVEAGTTLPQPVSATVRKLVFCVEGAVSVTRPGAAPVSLRPGEMTYVAKATAFDLTAGPQRAAVLIVYATVPPPPEHKH